MRVASVAFVALCFAVAAFAGPPNPDLPAAYTLGRTCHLVRYIAQGASRWFAVNDQGCGYYSGGAVGAPVSGSGYSVSPPITVVTGVADLRSSFVADSNAGNGAQKTLVYWGAGTADDMIFASGDNSIIKSFPKDRVCTPPDYTQWIDSGIPKVMLHGYPYDTETDVTAAYNTTASNIPGLRDVVAEPNADWTWTSVVLNRTAAEDPWVSVGPHLRANGQVGSLLYGENGWSENGAGHVDRINERGGVKVYLCTPPQLDPTEDGGVCTSCGSVTCPCMGGG